jgi:tRNA(Ile2) C34 agmatinyltransferase TiaS
MKDNKKGLIEPICRECDIIMSFEGENPDGYFLYKCPNCSHRTGLMINRKKVSEKKRKELEKRIFPSE